MSRTLLFGNYLSPVLQPAYARIAAFVGARCGLPARLRIGTSCNELLDGGTQVAFMCGLAYLRLRDVSSTVRAIAAPILLGRRYRRQAIYFSDLVVRAGSGYHTFGDLRGCRFACNEQASHSGFNLVAYSLIQRNDRLPFFGQVRQTGSHMGSLEAVATGLADAAAIDSQLLAVLSRRHDRVLNELRVIDSLGPSTSPPLVIHAPVAGLAEDIQAALCSMHRDADGRRSLAAGGISQLVETDDAAYADIARMRAIAAQLALGDVATKVVRV